MDSPQKTSNIYSICRPQKVRRIRCLVSVLKPLTKMHYSIACMINDIIDIYKTFVLNQNLLVYIVHICLDSQAREKDEEKQNKHTAAKAKLCPKPKASPAKPAEKHPAPSPDKTASPETAQASSQVPKRLRGKQTTETTELQQMKEAPTCVM